MRYPIQRAHVGVTYIYSDGNGHGYACIVTQARDFGRLVKLFILPGSDDAPPPRGASLIMWIPVERLYHIGSDEYDAEGNAVFPAYERPTTLQDFSTFSVDHWSPPAPESGEDTRR